MSLDSISPGESAPRYETMRRIGVGGMAEVFLARHHGEGGFQRLVVLKRPLPEQEDRRLEARLRREARLLGKLDHPGIATVHEVGRDERGLFIAMEYVDGHDLRAVIKAAKAADRPPGVAEMVSIAIQLAGALAHAHDKRDEAGRPLGIIHRDISPSNVVVRPDGVVKLLDFGVARDLDEPTITRSSELVGKLAYMSPEQIMRWTLDARSDLFSLGVTLWELAALRRPFPDADHVALLREIPQTDIPPMRTLRPDLPEELEGVLARLLARDVESRYPDARSLRIALADVAVSMELRDHEGALASYLAALFGSPSATDARPATSSGGNETTTLLSRRDVYGRAARSGARRHVPLAVALVLGVFTIGWLALGGRASSPADDDSIPPSGPAVGSAAASPDPQAPDPVVPIGSAGDLPTEAAVEAAASLPAAEPSPPERNREGHSARARSKKRSRPRKASTKRDPPALDPVLPPGFRGGAP